MCATINSGNTLSTTLPTWLLGQPDEVCIITNNEVFTQVSEQVSNYISTKFQIIRSPISNKRAQLCEGFRHTDSEIIIICDDDTTWSPVVLSRLLLPFTKDPNLGAVFPEVKFRSSGPQFNFWETLSATRLAGDAIDIRTSMLFDGGVFCASGTTAAYRGKILRDPAFLERFANETWMKRRLNAGDDQSITLWLYEHGWKCAVIADEGPGGFSVLTTPRTTWKHLSQLARWHRSDWQSCLRATVMTAQIWR